MSVLPFRAAISTAAADPKRPRGLGVLRGRRRRGFTSARRGFTSARREGGGGGQLPRAWGDNAGLRQTPGVTQAIRTPPTPPPPGVVRWFLTVLGGPWRRESPGQIWVLQELLFARLVQFFSTPLIG